MATKPRREATQRAPEAASDDNRSLCSLMNEAGLQLQGTLAELAARAQQRESEARIDYVREVQQADFDKAKADHEAHVAHFEALRGAGGEGEAGRSAGEAQRAAFDRYVDTQKRVADAGEAYRRAVEEAQAAHAEGLAEAYREHVSKLKSLWGTVDPGSVDPGDLALLGQMTLAVSQQGGFPSPASPAASERQQ